MIERQPKTVSERQSIDHIHTILLSEFAHFRSEIIERLRFQKQLERLAIFVIAALIGGLQFLISIDAEITLLLGSLLLFGIAKSFFSEDINIVFAAAYLESRVKPNIVAITSDYPKLKHEILGWEDYRSERFLPTTVSTIMTFNRNLSAFLPGTLAFSGFAYAKGLNNNFDFSIILWTNLEIVLLIINFFAFLFLLYMAVKVPSMYEKISKK